MVETAALLHDIDKALPYDHPLRALGHGNAGAAWLSEAGHPELAPTLRAHPVTRLSEAAAAEWVVNAPLEERVVAYADKRATQRVVSLDQRFDQWMRKHPRYAERLAEALVMARTLEAGVCAVVGVRADEIERLRWVDDAMARARSNGVLATREPADLARPLAGMASPSDPKLA